jgi:hypothetical protein
MFEKSFLITYHTDNFVDRDIILTLMKAFAAWAMITESTWIVKTNLTPTYIHDYIKPYLPENSRLFVVKVQKNGAWSNIMCPNDWINNNLNVI